MRDGVDRFPIAALIRQEPVLLLLLLLVNLVVNLVVMIFGVIC